MKSFGIINGRYPFRESTTQVDGIWALMFVFHINTDFSNSSLVGEIKDSATYTPYDIDAMVAYLILLWTCKIYIPSNI